MACPLGISSGNALTDNCSRVCTPTNMDRHQERLWKRQVALSGSFPNRRTASAIRMISQSYNDYRSTDKTIYRPASVASSGPLKTPPNRRGSHPQVHCTQPRISTEIHTMRNILLGTMRHSVRFDENYYGVGVLDD